MAKRLNQILEIVQQEIPTSFDPFVIQKHSMKQMFQDVKNAILSWKGPSLSTNTKLTNNNISKSSIKWFNKYNAKIYGNYFFYPIFVYILKVYNIYNISYKLFNHNKIWIREVIK